jgi:hypothetical protein
MNINRCRDDKKYDDHQATTLSELVKTHIPSSERILQTADGNLEFLLPCEEQPKFTSLFEILEAQPDIKVQKQDIKISCR